MGGFPHAMPTQAAQQHESAQATVQQVAELSPMAFAAAHCARLGGLLDAAQSLQQKMKVLTTPNHMGLMPIHLASVLGQHRLITFMLNQISNPAQTKKRKSNCCFSKRAMAACRSTLRRSGEKQIAWPPCWAT